MNRIKFTVFLLLMGSLAVMVFMWSSCATSGPKAETPKEQPTLQQPAVEMAKPAPEPSPTPAWQGDSLTTTSLNLWTEGSPEYRALWITRFEWPDKDPEKCKKQIIEIFDDMKAANFNTAVFQIRGSAETLYPSDMEPWSYIFDYKSPGFDPVGFAIDEAHKRGIEFHAYINPIPMAQARRGDDFPPPHTTPDHIYHKHGPESNEPWTCMNEKGEPMNAGAAGYVYFSPGIPEVQAYLREAIMDAVRRYDFDGVHLDRIRYPGRQYSHDPISKRRYYEAGNPNRREWEDWQREQLTKFINDLKVEIAAEKPNIVFSAAVWGIYNRYDIEGYHRFSSGYHDYYQDSWDWVRIGAMDVLYPMIYWNIPNPTPNYHELLDVFVKNVGKEHLVGGQTVFRGETPLAENIEEIRYTRNVGGLGTCQFAYGSMKRNNGFEILKNSLYQQPVETPKLDWMENPKTGFVLGRVLDEKGQPLTDAWVSLSPVEGDRDARRATAFSRTWPSSSDGRFAFNAVPPIPVRIDVRYKGLPTVSSEPIAIIAGQVSKIDITIPDSSAHREDLFFNIMAPAADSETSEEAVHLLGRTNPRNLIEVNGQVVDVYHTGGFAKDNISLAMGDNEITVAAYAPDGRSTQRVIRVKRVEQQERGPAPDQRQRPGAEPPKFESFAGNPWVAEVTQEWAGLTWGLHDVRLGGPYAAEARAGTRLVIIGRQGENLMVRLGANQSAWIAERAVKRLDDGTAAPHAWFTSISISSEEPYDVVALGLNAPVLVAATCATHPQNVIYLDLFDTHWASTWNSHKTGAKIVGPVSGEQISEGHVRLTIPVHSKQIWGYWLDQKGGSVKLFVKRPPALSENPEKPFDGLYIAVEAGHGGGNNGAIGLMGQLEKTVNRQATDALTRKLESMGASVIQTRIGDEELSLQKRVQRAIDAEADLFVSMHSNAAGNQRGYLRISGTSTYYKHEHAQRMAQLIYDELLKLDWGEFGVVGNFNYTPIRMTHMPSILVEQAFMSNPYDEARLTDPKYQEEQAAAIATGLARFLDAVRE